MSTKAKRYIGIVAAVLILGVLYVCAPFYKTVFRQLSKAYVSDGGYTAVKDAKMPLTASVNVGQRSGMIDFSFLLQDAAGAKTLPPARSEPPKVKVFDSGGKLVYACTLEYG